MQRILQINIAGRIIPIEEDAYQLLKNYIGSLTRQFMGEQGHDEIILDIEHRIAELFFARLNSGAPAIDRADVQKVIETLGAANELNDTANYGSSQANAATSPNTPVVYNPPYQESRRLYRNTNDKILGGVCSGIAAYFDIDPVIVRLIFAGSLFIAGVGFLTYILAWIIIPAAKTPYEMRGMMSGTPMNFNTIQKNVTEEMMDLKRRGEQMSRELQDFFSKKK